MIGIMELGANAVYAGMKRLDGIASEIATQPVQPVAATGQIAGQQTGTHSSTSKRDLNEPLVEQNQVTYTVQAGVKVIEVGNKMMGTVLNMFA